LLFSQAAAIGQERIYSTQSGTISFVSDAPLEVIAASSKKMEGVIDIEAMTFAFSVTIRTFEGFNNGLQRQHFYENYMETDKYPVATFSGKIIEHIELSKPGTYTVRAKGQLTIHGREKERIIKVELISTGKEIKATTMFFVPLVDHQIEVPRIVNQKIAQEIEVKVNAVLYPTGRP
jgi:polyisoprenoid-binding protein YceI